MFQWPYHQTDLGCDRMITSCPGKEACSFVFLRRFRSVLQANPHQGSVSIETEFGRQTVLTTSSDVPLKSVTLLSCLKVL